MQVAPDTTTDPVVPPRESGPPPPPDGGRFCTPDAAQTFCADFDDGILAQGWDDVGTPRGALALVDSGARSDPFALEVLAAETDSGYRDGPYLRKAFPGPFEELSCSIAFRHSGPFQGQKTYALLSFALLDGAEITIHLTTAPVEGGLLWIFEPYDGGARTVDSRRTTVGSGTTFRRIDLKFTRTSLALSVDGVPVSPLAYDQVSPITQARFAIGAPIIDHINVQPWRAVFDDVTCTIAP